MDEQHATQSFSFQNSAVFSRRENLLTRRVDDDLIIYDVETNKIVALNYTAKAIWFYCDGQRSCADIVNKLLTDFNAKEQVIAKSVLSTIEKLHKLGLLVSQRLF